MRDYRNSTQESLILIVTPPEGDAQVLILPPKQNYRLRSQDAMKVWRDEGPPTPNNQNGEPLLPPLSKVKGRPKEALSVRLPNGSMRMLVRKVAEFSALPKPTKKAVPQKASPSPPDASFTCTLGELAASKGRQNLLAAEARA